MKKNFQYLVMFVAASICNVSSMAFTKTAQDGTDYSFLNLKGKVKTIISVTQKWSEDERSYFDENTDTIGFSRKGKVISGKLNEVDFGKFTIGRNDKGRINRLNYEDENGGVTDIVYTWGMKHVLKCESTITAELSVSSVVNRFYDSKGNRIKDTLSGISDGNGYSGVRTYTYNSTDDKGNWTECIMNVEQDVEEPEDPDDPDSKIIKTKYREKYKIVRKIMYY